MPLLQTYALNKTLKLKNRVVMAPMTRSYAGLGSVATFEMAEYYARRAEAGLIVTECSIIRPDGMGYADTPGIFTAEQIEAWRQVTERVHANNGLIFLQIWHAGRVTHPVYIGGKLPFGPSAASIEGRVPRSNGLMYGESRALAIDEIQQLIEDYANAAANAHQAGFDGVEIHGANGYLIDQFLHYSSNQRTDEYGASPENMARFALDVVHAVGARIGYDRVGIRLSPAGYLNSIESDTRDAEVFAYLLQQLNAIDLAYVHTGNFDDRVLHPELNNLSMTGFMRHYYQGTLIASGSYTLQSASEGIASNQFDLIAMGRPFIANPDLVHRIRTQQPWQAYDASMLNTLY